MRDTDILIKIVDGQTPGTLVHARSDEAPDSRRRSPLATNSITFRSQLTLDAPVLGADLRYIDIESKVTLDGTSIVTVKIDPWVYGLSVGFSF